MLSLKKIKFLIITFKNDTLGNFAIIFALTMIPVLISASVAIDYSRMVATKSQLQNSLDAALLSAASDFSMNKITQSQLAQNLNHYLVANVNNRRFDISNTQSTVTDMSVSFIEAEAATEFKYAFPLFGGEQSRQITVNAKVSTPSKLNSLEVAMILDITGSMSGFLRNPDPTDEKILKIDHMKKIFLNLTNILLKDPSQNIRIAFIPFAGGVNPGPQFSSAVIDGKPCSSERLGTNMFTDASPTRGLVASQEQFFPAPPYPQGYLHCSPYSPIIPLTKDKNILIDALNRMGHIFSPTAGHIGIEWGQYMLSPSWKNLMSPDQYPKAYNAPGSKKIMIIFTDGAFNTQYIDPATTSYRDHPDITSFAGDLAINYCDNLKKNNIQIYTIGFDIEPDDPSAYPTPQAFQDEVLRYKDAIATLKECASTPDDFFDVASAKKLNIVLEYITNDMLTKNVTLIQ
jgi:Flp pilus assembly protein TadG